MTHVAHIHWMADGDVASGNYSRAHEWVFDGGLRVPASASPDIVPAPLSQPENVDPEEGFVATIASCHMLWFLDFARRAGFEAARYHDHAVGHMEETEDQGLWVARIDLNVSVEWSGTPPSEQEHKTLHDQANAACFIAKSIKSEINVSLVNEAEVDEILG